MSAARSSVEHGVHGATHTMYLGHLCLLAVGLGELG